MKALITRANTIAWEFTSQGGPVSNGHDNSSHVPEWVGEGENSR